MPTLISEYLSVAPDAVEGFRVADAIIGSTLCPILMHMSLPAAPRRRRTNGCTRAGLGNRGLIAGDPLGDLTLR